MISRTRSDGVVTITLDRSEKRNAMSVKMWADLGTVLRDIASRPTDRVVVLTGAGNHFCGGGDMVDARDNAAPELQTEVMRLAGEAAMALHRLPQPTIAKVRGYAVGAGCNLALGCDLLVASDDAHFSEIFIERGLSLDCGGSWLLPRRVGLHRAKELAFFGTVLDAEQALQIGFVNRVVPGADLDATVEEYCQRLIARAPIALTQSKQLLNNGMLVTMSQAVDDEARAQALNFCTEATTDALGAFAPRPRG